MQGAGPLAVRQGLLGDREGRTSSREHPWVLLVKLLCVSSNSCCSKSAAADAPDF